MLAVMSGQTGCASKSAPAPARISQILAMPRASPHAEESNYVCCMGGKSKVLALEASEEKKATSRGFVLPTYFLEPK